MYITRMLPVLVLALAPGIASAQLCRGGVDFAAARLQGQVQLEMDEFSSSYAVAGGLGGAQYFGTASVGVRTYESRGGETVYLGVGGGRVFTNHFTGRAIHCIEVSGAFGSGPDAPGEVRADESSSALTFDLMTGVPLRARSVQLIPFGGVAMRWGSVVVQSDNSSTSVNDTHFFFTLGLGIAGGELYSLQPYVQLPTGREAGNDPVFGMRFSMNFGRRD